MPTARKRIAVSLEREIPQREDYKKQPGQKIYGSLVFNDTAQKQYLSKDVYKKLRATTQRGEPIDPSISNQVAQGLQEWALEHGASHYTHWFVPMTGLTAEKHDAFIEPATDGSAIIEYFAPLKAWLDAQNKLLAQADAQLKGSGTVQK